MERVGPYTEDLAVNLHHGGAAVDAHLPAWVHRSVERSGALGTAGALGALRGWIDGRPVLLSNGDAWFDGLVLDDFVAQWDRTRVRLLCVLDPARGDFGDLRYCGVALLPWATVAGLAPEPSGLYEVSWQAEAAAGRLDLVVHRGTFIDVASVVDYLAANLAVSGGRSVIDPGAVVSERAIVERSVVWAGAEIGPDQHVWQSVATPSRRVLIRA